MPAHQNPFLSVAQKAHTMPATSDYFIHTGDDEFGGFYVSRPSEGWRA